MVHGSSRLYAMRIVIVSIGPRVGSRPGKSLDIDHLKDSSCRDQKLPLARKRRVRPQIGSQARGDREEGALGGIVRDEGVEGAHIRGGAGEAPKHNCLSQLRPVDGLEIKRDSSPENTGSRA